MKQLIWSLVPAFFLLTACSTEEPADNSVDRAALAAAESEALAVLVEDYFVRELELNPLNATFIGDYRFDDHIANFYGPEHIAATLALNEEYLAKAIAMDQSLLEGQDLLTYEMFQLDREMAIEGDKYPGHLQPMSQFFSMPSFMVQLGSGASAHQFKTVKNYDDFLSRIDDYLVIADQMIVNMREGMEQGIVRPTILMGSALPILASQIHDNAEDSAFWQPITNMPEDFSDEDRTRLTDAYRVAIIDKLVPSYQKLHDFVRDEYMPVTRDSHGMVGMPGGKEWYAFQVKNTTTTNLAPDEIHQIGLDEVARIHGEMQAVMDEVGFEGDLAAFFDFLNTDDQFYYDEPDQLIQGYRDMADHVTGLSNELFSVFPKAAFEVRRVEAFREKSASGGSYSTGTPDGERPGIFYANAYDIKSRPIWAMESLFLHEAIPGHHFQLSIQQEVESLPRFRRFGGYTAFIEGWALYAESLGKEMGVYADPYQYFGALNAELWRAIRLVVDTGLHSKGWTKQDVLDYMYENSAVKEARAVSEAERYMAIPSQALAYKIGQLKIRELRNRAEQALGDGFDVKAFHREVLIDGALPLNTLERKIDRWIESQQ